jgi:hypothetical protein
MATVVEGAADNAKRGVRTGLQAAAGFLVAVPVIDIWNNYVENHSITDPTFKFAVGVILAALVSWAHNKIEDATGKGFLEPVDRMAGDAVLGDGVGAAKGTITGDTTPYAPTLYTPNNESWRHPDP